MDIIQIITRELKVEKWQVEAAVKLIDEGCTIPFISSYTSRKTDLSSKSGRQEKSGAWKHRGTGKADPGTEKTDSGCADTCGR